MSNRKTYRPWKSSAGTRLLRARRAACVFVFFLLIKIFEWAARVGDFFRAAHKKMATTNKSRRVLLLCSSCVCVEFLDYLLLYTSKLRPSPCQQPKFSQACLCTKKKATLFTQSTSYQETLSSTQYAGGGEQLRLLQ